MIDWVETKKQFGRSDLSGRRPKVSVRCDVCNKLGSKTINNKSKVDGDNYKWLCKSCSVKKQWDDGHFQNHSGNMKNKWKNPEYRAIFQSDEFKNKKRKQSVEIWSNEEMIQSARERSKLLWKDDNFRNKAAGVADIRKLSESSKKLWQDSDYRRRVIESSKKTLNSDEYKKKSMITRDQFIEKASNLHGNTYDYSNVEYKGYKEKVDIICRVHGLFSQRVINHLQGCGCPKCPKHSSLQEQELCGFIKSIYDGNVVESDRCLIKPYEIDILIPKLKLAIEYNGNYWHSHNKPESTFERMKHSMKHDMCLGVGYQLIQITEAEWKYKQDIVKSRLKHLFNSTNNIIYARQCKVVNIKNDIYKKFVEDNHLQGHKHACVKLGLVFQDQLVCVMSFNRHSKYEWEITRFANKINCSVVGGANRLFKHFQRENKPNMVMTYADRRYSIGSVYEKLGFDLDGVTKPNYVYTDKDVVFSRQQFQKNKLKDRLDKFDPLLTEAQNMFNNGYRRMWDAGHYKFIWVNK